MNESEFGELYREGVSSSGPDPEGCPRPEKLEMLASRAGPEAERMKTLDHVMGCESCREEFELLRAIASSERSDTETAQTSGFRIPFALAASITGLVAVGAMWQLSNRPDPVVRGPADSVRVVEPIGTVDDLGVVRWTGSDDDAQFELVLSDLGGTPFFTTTTSDTVVTIPDGVEVPAEGVIQLVVTTLSDGRTTLSPVEFRVRR